MLEVEELTVARGRRVLLEGLSLRVRAGELLHVAGPNGCGKSSLLRVLAGVVEPRRGQVRRRAACAYVPERVALPESLQARRWLSLTGAVDAALPDELQARAGTLSKGQLQRLVLTGALDVGDDRDRILVFDEPWAGLDAAAREELGARLTAIAAGGSAVIFTDHSDAATVTASRTLALARVEPRL